MLSVKLRTCLCLNVLMQIDIKNVPSGPIDNKPVQWNLYKATTNFMVFQERWSFTTGRINMIYKDCQMN